jgi:hypothetical protein
VAPVVDCLPGKGNLEFKLCITDNNNNNDDDDDKGLSRRQRKLLQIKNMRAGIKMKGQKGKLKNSQKAE